MTTANNSKLKTYGEWAIALFMIFVLSASLPFKFTGHAQPTHIFEVVGTWLHIGLLRDHGAVIIGVFELIASLLLLVPSLRIYGAGLAFGIISGAIVFHLFSPLGVNVVFYADADKNPVSAAIAEAAGGPYADFFTADSLGEALYYQGVDTELFWLAVGTWIGALIIFALRKGEVLALLGKGDA